MYEEHFWFSSRPLPHSFLVFYFSLICSRLTDSKPYISIAYFIMSTTTYSPLSTSLGISTAINVCITISRKGFVEHCGENAWLEFLRDREECGHELSFENDECSLFILDVDDRVHSYLLSEWFRSSEGSSCQFPSGSGF